MNLSKLNLLYPNKTALITGAGSGLGLALTKLLITNGWKIFAIDINIYALELIMNNNLKHYKLDITNLKDYESLVNNIISKDQIDILFNNAGVGEGSLFIDYDLTNWDWIININLKAQIAGIKYLLPHFLDNKNGMIVNISSAAGYSNLPKMSPYNVTKAALISLSETLSHELSKTNIKIKLITPTFFKSSIMQHSKGNSKIISAAQKFIQNSNITSEDAAKIILSNLHHNRLIVRFPFNAKLLYFGKKWFPRIFYLMVKRFLS